MKLCKEGQVMTCHVAHCSYNHEQTCQAKHIQVGSPSARCDTFTTEMAQQMSTGGEMSSVRACDVTDCSLNKDMSCDASGITVHFQDGHADCLTFREAAPRFPGEIEAVARATDDNIFRVSSESDSAREDRVSGGGDVV
jgi:hypothetical protein